MLTRKRTHSDNFALTKGCLSLCGGSFAAGLPSQSPAVTALPRGEPIAAHGQQMLNLGDALPPPLGEVALR